MASYAATATSADRTKAVAAVVLVHLALAFVILSGLNVRMIGHAVEHLRTFDVVELPPPPPEPPPPPAKQVRQVKHEAGAPAKKAEATPVVAPKPKVETPPVSPVVASPISGTGSASHPGASTAGTGTGAGGTGNGLGGGGDYSKFTPAQRISKIPDREYRRLSATGIRNGSVGITIRVNTDGRISNCRIARSSGNSVADSTMCQLAGQYVRFRPALDPARHPVAQDITWYPNWWKP
jgi:periplasmic protein TonB